MEIWSFLREFSVFFRLSIFPGDSHAAELDSLVANRA